MMQSQTSPYDVLIQLSDWAKLDASRKARTGVAEAVFSAGKTVEQILEISQRLSQANGRVLVTRLLPGIAQQLAHMLPAPWTIERYASDRLAVVTYDGAAPPPSNGRVVGILAAGTSDIPVAEEARLTAMEMGCGVLHFYDVGIATLQRLIVPLQQLQQAEAAVIVVVAGMEGALASVVKSLVPVPVIGVPTSVSYGYGQPGEAALMSMLNSCVPGLTVVNIDNGFGAGATAALIASAFFQCAD